LCAAGNLPDTAAGWRHYADYLAWQAEEGPAGRNAAYASLSRGWAIGGDDFKRALLEDEAVMVDARAWEGEGARQVREARWAEALQRVLQLLPAKAQVRAYKSAPWKVAAAAYLKETTDVSNGWLAKQLDMGSHFYVSKHVGRLRLFPQHEAKGLLELLRKKVKGKA